MPEAWNRVQRYASWMFQVHIDWRSALGEDTIPKLRFNSPAGGWFLALKNLYWCITKSNLPYADLCFSPHLKKISIFTPWSWSNSQIPHDILPAIVSTISTLPTSALQSLLVDISCHANTWADFVDRGLVLSLRDHFVSWDRLLARSKSVV